MKIGCVSLVICDDMVVALQCGKGRGTILPGGKRDGLETFKQCAARELKEEAGLTATGQRYIFGAADGNDFYCMTFLTEIDSLSPMWIHGTPEGVPVLAPFQELLQSYFRGYYEILADSFTVDMKARLRL